MERPPDRTQGAASDDGRSEAPPPVGPGRVAWEPARTEGRTAQPGRAGGPTVGEDPGGAGDGHSASGGSGPGAGPGTGSASDAIARPPQDLPPIAWEPPAPHERPMAPADSQTRAGPGVQRVRQAQQMTPAGGPPLSDERSPVDRGLGVQPLDHLASTDGGGGDLGGGAGDTDPREVVDVGSVVRNVPQQDELFGLAGGSASGGDGGREVEFAHPNRATPALRYQVRDSGEIELADGTVVAPDDWRRVTLSGHGAHPAVTVFFDPTTGQLLRAEDGWIEALDASVVSFVGEESDPRPHRLVPTRRGVALVTAGAGGDERTDIVLPYTTGHGADVQPDNSLGGEAAAGRHRADAGDVAGVPDRGAMPAVLAAAESLVAVRYSHVGAVVEPALDALSPPARRGQRAADLEREWLTFRWYARVLPGLVEMARAGSSPGAIVREVVRAALDSYQTLHTLLPDLPLPTTLLGWPWTVSWLPGTTGNAFNDLFRSALVAVVRVTIDDDAVAADLVKEWNRWVEGLGERPDPNEVSRQSNEFAERARDLAGRYSSAHDESGSSLRDSPLFPVPGSSSRPPSSDHDRLIWYEEWRRRAGAVMGAELPVPLSHSQLMPLVSAHVAEAAVRVNALPEEVRDRAEVTLAQILELSAGLRSADLVFQLNELYRSIPVGEGVRSRQHGPVAHPQHPVEGQRQGPGQEPVRSEDVGRGEPATPPQEPGSRNDDTDTPPKMHRSASAPALAPLRRRVRFSGLDPEGSGLPESAGTDEPSPGQRRPPLSRSKTVSSAESAHTQDLQDVSPLPASLGELGRARTEEFAQTLAAAVPGDGPANLRRSWNDWVSSLGASSTRGALWVKANEFLRQARLLPVQPQQARSLPDALGSLGPNWTWVFRRALVELLAAGRVSDSNRLAREWNRWVSSLEETPDSRVVLSRAESLVARAQEQVRAGSWWGDVGPLTEEPEAEETAFSPASSTTGSLSSEERTVEVHALPVPLGELGRAWTDLFAQVLSAVHSVRGVDAAAHQALEWNEWVDGLGESLDRGEVWDRAGELVERAGRGAAGYPADQVMGPATPPAAEMLGLPIEVRPLPQSLGVLGGEWTQLFWSALVAVMRVTAGDAAASLAGVWNNWASGLSEQPDPEQAWFRVDALLGSARASIRAYSEAWAQAGPFATEWLWYPVPGSTFPASIPDRIAWYSWLRITASDRKARLGERQAVAMVDAYRTAAAEWVNALSGAARRSAEQTLEDLMLLAGEPPSAELVRELSDLYRGLHQVVDLPEASGSDVGSESILDVAESALASRGDLAAAVESALAEFRGAVRRTLMESWQRFSEHTEVLSEVTRRARAGMASLEDVSDALTVAFDLYDFFAYLIPELPDPYKWLGLERAELTPLPSEMGAAGRAWILLLRRASIAASQLTGDDSLEDDMVGEWNRWLSSLEGPPSYAQAWERLQELLRMAFAAIADHEPVLAGQGQPAAAADRPTIAEDPAPEPGTPGTPGTAGSSTQSATPAWWTVPQLAPLLVPWHQAALWARALRVEETQISLSAELVVALLRAYDEAPAATWTRTISGTVDQTLERELGDGPPADPLASLSRLSEDYRRQFEAGPIDAGGDDPVLRTGRRSPLRTGRRSPLRTPSESEPESSSESEHGWLAAESPSDSEQESSEPGSGRERSRSAGSASDTDTELEAPEGPPRRRVRFAPDTGPREQQDAVRLIVAGLLSHARRLDTGWPAARSAAADRVSAYRVDDFTTAANVDLLAELASLHAFALQMSAVLHSVELDDAQKAAEDEINRALQALPDRVLAGPALRAAFERMGNPEGVADLIPDEGLLRLRSELVDDAVGQVTEDALHRVVGRTRRAAEERRQEVLNRRDDPEFLRTVQDEVLQGWGTTLQSSLGGRLSDAARWLVDAEAGPAARAEQSGPAETLQRMLAGHEASRLVGAPGQYGRTGDEQDVTIPRLLPASIQREYLESQKRPDQPPAYGWGYFGGVYLVGNVPFTDPEEIVKQITSDWEERATQAGAPQSLRSPAVKTAVETALLDYVRSPERSRQDFTQTVAGRGFVTDLTVDGTVYHVKARLVLPLDENNVRSLVPQEVPTTQGIGGRANVLFDMGSDLRAASGDTTTNVVGIEAYGAPEIPTTIPFLFVGLPAFPWLYLRLPVGCCGGMTGLRRRLLEIGGDLCCCGSVGVMMSACVTPSCISSCWGWRRRGRWTGSSSRLPTGGSMCGWGTRSGTGSCARNRGAAESWRCATTPRSGQWRHLDSCQFLTYLHARPPRVDCPDHGARQVRLPWAEPMSRFTTLFERLAIDVLKECDVQGAARLLRLSSDEAWRVSRAVGRGVWPPSRRRCQRASGWTRSPPDGARTTSPWSATWTRGTVEYIADERRQASLDGYFTRLTAEQRERIQAVAMDMWEPLHPLGTGSTSATPTTRSSSTGTT